jgi:hypothetical protein
VTRSRSNGALWRIAKQLSAHGSRVATLAAYGYQAVAALGLVLAVAHVLTGPEYARFSLTLATAQFAAIGAFEWVRIAATRFYPGPDPDAAPLQKASLGAGFVASALVGGIVSVSAMLGGAPVLVVLLGAAVAIGQGLTDLHLTFVRFRGDLGAFARAQSLRATAMIGFAAGGAVLTGAATGALAGIVLAHAVLILVALITDPHLRSTPWRHPSAELIRAQMAYGAPAAGASILYLATTLMARYTITLISPGAAGAGTLLAFDLIQRPFAVVTTALHALLYPPVVREFDRGGFDAARAPLRRLYVIELGCILALAAGLAAALSLSSVVSLIAPDQLSQAFSEAALLCILIFATRTALLSLAPLVLHLTRRTKLMAAINLSDPWSFLVLVAGVSLLKPLTTAYVLVGFLLSSTMAMVITMYASKSVGSNSR